MCKHIWRLECVERVQFYQKAFIFHHVLLHLNLTSAILKNLVEMKFAW